MKSILIVEDNDEDFDTFQRVFTQMNGTTLIRCRDGKELMCYLAEPPDDVDARPSMILLDLNMPGTDGRETLVRLKSDPEWRSIPAVIFSTSTSPKDIVYCYDHGVNGYMNKPVNNTELERNLRSFVDYWEHTMLLPSPADSRFPMSVRKL